MLRRALAYGVEGGAGGFADVRLGHRVAALRQVSGGVQLDVECGEESGAGGQGYGLTAEYVVAADGANSVIRCVYPIFQQQELSA